MAWNRISDSVAFGTTVALSSGLAEFIMTGGESGWIPLWAGIFGVVAGLIYAVVSRKLLGDPSPEWGLEGVKDWLRPQTGWFHRRKLKRRFQRTSGVGKIAADLIWLCRDDLKECEYVFDTFRTAPNRTDEAYPYFVFSAVFAVHNNLLACKLHQ